MTTNWYGLLVGLGVVVVLELFERKAKQNNLFIPEVKKLLFVGLCGALVGARSWHVGTDWSLYQENILSAFFIWRGGMSVIGAIVGVTASMIGAAFFWRYSKKTLLATLDLLAFSAPFGQIIGRVGNWFNQELYGLPTTLPWKIFIEPVHRSPQFTEFEYFHPLFLYEALLLLFFGVFLWVVSRKQTTILGRVGTGKYFSLYLGYYCIIRFLLDFLRIEKAVTPLFFLSFNQLFLGLCLIGVLVAWFFVYAQGKKARLLVTAIASGLLLVMAGASYFYASTQVPPIVASNNQTEVPSFLKQTKYDRGLAKLRLGEHLLTVEVVNTPGSITKGLSGRPKLTPDGMLFVFPFAQHTTFWMPAMQFDLDIIWIKDGRVVGLEQAVPRPSPETSLQDLPRYPSPGAVELVLELAAGRAKELGITVGTLVFLEELK